MMQALIIDDNPNNARVLQQLLQIEGVQTLVISKTKDLAQQLAAIADVAVIFLDLEMPLLNGYQALDLIKAQPHLQAARVVAYSVHVSEAQNVLTQGFDGFLGKPLSAEAFPQQWQRILKGDVVYYIP